MADMIDAYTIGITLALEDGVSDGITAIRRDLAELDLAVAESAARLLMLRHLAADLVLPAPPDRPMKHAALFAPPTFRPETAPPPVTAADFLAVAPPVTRPLSSVPIPTVHKATPAFEVPSAGPRAPAVLPATGTASAKPATSVPPIPGLSAQIAPPPAMLPAAQSPSVAPKAVLASAVPIGQPTSERRGSTSPGPPPEPDKPIDFAEIARSQAPSVPKWRHQDPDRLLSKAPEPVSRPVIMAPLTPQSQKDAAQSPPKIPAPAEMPATPRLSLPLPPPHYLEPRQQQAQAPASVSPPSGPSHPVRPFPITPPAGYPPAAYARATAPAPPTLGTVSSDRPQADGLVSAELHLDGVAIGRWVTRHLERQVTRPQAGATGFDPRMSPSWTGAPIGN